MPIMRCTLSNGKSGFRYGQQGKCYPTRAQAERQRKAILASGYKEKGEKKK